MFLKPMSKLNMGVSIQKATADDAQEVAVMTGELLSEIMVAVGVQVFHFDLDETADRLKDFLNREKYVVFVARSDTGSLVGFVALYESYALYAEGAFGTIPELYVCPEYRSKNIGLRLVAQAKSFGISQGWKRLEVTTPPLPHYANTLAFYEREGFNMTGGRKLKLTL